MQQIRPAYMKVICPTAPTMPVTLNAGFRMPSWFDLKTLDMYGPEDMAGIHEATKNVHQLIETEITAGISANRIIVGGFSQGGALALHAGLTFSEPLGGIVGLSCWLPLHKSFPAAKKTADSVPIFQCHGEVDPVVPYKFGQLSHYSLKTFMTNAQFVSYKDLSHSSSQEEMNAVQVNQRIHIFFFSRSNDQCQASHAEKSSTCALFALVFAHFCWCFVVVVVDTMFFLFVTCRMRIYYDVNAQL